MPLAKIYINMGQASAEGALGIPNDFAAEALGNGDCFFDTLAQGVT
jgi:hypothetical protein